MHQTCRISTVCAAALSLLAGCATVNPGLDYGRTAEHIERATGHEAVYRPDDEQIARQKVDELLQGGLSVGEAVQVCLLNNPSLQAKFQDVGMARADVVQAGLFSNPSLSLALRLPAGGGLANLDAGIAQNIADLWQIPARKRAAERSLDRTILDIAREAADLAADAKYAYYATVSQQQVYEITQENLVVAKELLDVAVTRQDAGAGNVLDVNLSRGKAIEGELALESARLRAADAGRALAELLGLTSEADLLVLLDPLPDPPSQEPEAEALIQLARQWRLDLRAAEQAVAAAEARLEEQYHRIFPNLEIGVDLERDARKAQGGRKILADTARASIANGALTAPDIQPRSERQRNKRTDFIIGPSIGLVLPIFDQNQAQIAKAKFALARATKALEALDRAATQDIRSATDRARTAWRMVRLYRDRLVPLAQSNLDLSREAYRAGRTSFLSVLEAQRFFLETRKGHVGAAHTAAASIPELERSIGLPFPKLVEEAGADGTTNTPPEQETAP